VEGRLEASLGQAWRRRCYVMLTCARERYPIQAHFTNLQRMDAVCAPLAIASAACATANASAALRRSCIRRLGARVGTTITLLTGIFIVYWCRWCAVTAVTLQADGCDSDRKWPWYFTMDDHKEHCSRRSTLHLIMCPPVSVRSSRRVICSTKISG
jgi:hypothetical protein